jgi:hypothetical protein
LTLLVSVFFPSSTLPKNETLQKLALFPYSRERMERYYLAGPERERER